VPRVPVWLRGVINLRGEILAVVDFRSFLGIDPLEQAGAGRLLVVRSAHNEITTGLIVDEVNGLRELLKDEIMQPSASIQDRIAPFLQGLHGQGKELLAVLNMETFLSSSELQV